MNRTRKILSYREIFGAGYPQLYLVLAGSVAVTAGNVYLRWSIGEALDGGGLSPWLLAVAAGLLAVTQLQSCHRQILSAKVQRDIYHRLQAKVLHSTMAGLERSDMGAITTYYITDVGQVDSFTARILYKAFPDLAGWLATVGLLFSFDLILGAAAVAVTALPAWFMHRMSRPIARGMDQYQGALEEANQSVVSGLHNIETIKASCREERFLQEDREKLAVLQKKKKVIALWEALLGAPMLLGSFLSIILLTGLGGWLVLAERISPGQLLTVVTLVDSIISFVMSLDGTISVFRRASVSQERLNRFLEQEEEQQGDRDTGTVREIAFDRIFFSYPGTEKEIYGGFSERWQPGGICFVKGGNGEGKSTLVKLVTGIYRVCGGRILVNDIPLEQCRLESLRERIVAVPQENILFQGSIRDNLTCGRDISPEAVEEVCRKVGIHEEIAGMPEGYDSVLTENGGVLSGGQKQRLCLARALLRQGDVYLFDEPTSALDQGRSRLLMEELEKLARDRIVVVITHEREFLEGAERVMRVGGQEG